jgi:hypothetical protein
MKSQNIKIPTTANIAELMVRPVENAAKRTTLNPFARQARKSRKGTPSCSHQRYSLLRKHKAVLAVYSVHRYKSYYFNITEIVAVIIYRWCAFS